MRKILSVGKYNMDGEMLGCGNFGRVELATHTLTNVKVAIKVIDTRKLSTAYASNNLYREARVLARVRHPHVVRMYETLKAGYLYCLILEYVSNKHLGSYLKTLPLCRMSEMAAWPLIRQLASGLMHLHQRNIVHRDLKMENILLDDGNKNIKIIDFGLSNVFAAGELLKTQCGSPEYAAPELFCDRQDYGPEVDAWSFGVIVFGTLVGELPFVPGSMEPSKRHALLKMLNKGLTGEHRKRMLHLDIDCRTLLFQLIEPNSALRLRMEDVAEHVWVTRNGQYPLWVDVEPDIDRPLRAKVLKKLAELHGMEVETVRQHVSELKYDSLSSQYNMLMDKYSELRRAQNITASVSKLQKKVASKAVISSNQTAVHLTRTTASLSPHSKLMKKAASPSVKRASADKIDVKTHSLNSTPTKVKELDVQPNPIITISRPKSSEDISGEMDDSSHSMLLFLDSAAADKQTLPSGGSSSSNNSPAHQTANVMSSAEENSCAVDITCSNSSSHLLQYAEGSDDTPSSSTPPSQRFYELNAEEAPVLESPKHHRSPITPRKKLGKGARMKEWIKSSATPN